MLITVTLLFSCLAQNIISENVCPMNCECLEHEKCQWSKDLIQKIEMARIGANADLWNFYNSQYRKKICSFEEKKICCCQKNTKSGFTEKTTVPKIKLRKFDLFQFKSPCNCVFVNECNEIKKLVLTKKWNKKKNDFTACGDDKTIPKFCCPKK